MMSPKPKLGFLNRTMAWVSANRLDVLAVGFLIVLASFSHGFNMLSFPYFENDEATYAARGWALASDGQLDPYTYRYDHAPFGWMLIAAWQLLTGGANIFGSFFASGRVMMLVCFVALVLMLYRLGLHFVKSRLAVVTALVIFILSPLGIYFQRRLLLDNIMTLLLVGSMLLAFDPRRRLIAFQASAMALGLAILTKLTAVFALPAIAYLIYLRASKISRKHILVQWFGVLSIVVILFVMFALLKGEFFPAQLDANGTPKNVSLITTMNEQLGRGEAIAFWNSDSWFWVNFVDWLRRDAFIIIIGLLGVVATAYAGIKNRLNWVIFLYCAGFILFFLRGKLVINHYIIPLLPGLALAAAVLIGKTEQVISKIFKNRDIKKGALVGFSLGLMTIATLNGTLKTYRENENNNLYAAQQWVKNNVNQNSVLIIDNYAYPALKYQYGYNKAFYMFPAEYDPAVRKQYGDDWRNISYILVTHEVYKQMREGSLPTVKAAFENSKPVAIFRTGSTSYIDDAKLISTNGDWAAIFKVTPPIEQEKESVLGVSND